ncbi:MAG: alginate export family protein [Bacteroidota bacterium]
MIKNCICILIAWLLNVISLYGQTAEEGVPSIKLLRAEENYLFLMESDSLSESIFFPSLKLISLNKDEDVLLTLGGEYRVRLESFTNELYSPEDDHFYSQRVDFHASLKIKQRIRLFAELYHGFTSEEQRVLESDQIDLHQGFLEVLLVDKPSASMTLRLGRQEIGYGASRLIGIREGPNMRRSFDLVNLSYRKPKGSLNLIYGKELTYGFDSFDNTSRFFDEDAQNPVIWGAYMQDNLVNGIGKLDFYYFGFKVNTARFNDVIGEETRHSVGVRSYGKAGRFSFNTELIYQFGTLGDSDISAYNFETDWGYYLSESGWKPKIGLRLDFSSGDRAVGDGKIQTFNPMFVNPAIYSLAAVNTPANLTGFHPNLTFYPSEKLSVYMDYALFYRTTSSDGLYSPPRFLLRESGSVIDRHIGDVLGIQINWEINRHMAFDLRSSIFFAGDFIEATGDAENTFYVAPTFSVKF